MGILSILLAGGLALSTPAFHTALDHTDPADGDTLAVSPPEISVHFTGPIVEAGRSMTLTGPGGTTLDLETTLPGEGATVLSAAIPSLTRGGYRVEWRVVAPDGHPLEGELVFFVEGPEESPASVGDTTSMTPEMDVGAESGGSAGSGSAMTPPPSSQSGGAGSPSGSWLTLATGAAAGLNVALLGLAGLLAFAAWGPGAPGKVSLQSSLALGIGATLFAPAYAWFWVGRTFPGAEGVLGRLDGLLSLGAGQAIAAQIGLVWAAVWVLAVMRRIGAAAVLALAAVVVGSASGHALATTPAISLPANALHLLAVSAWIGGLLFIWTERRSSEHMEVILRVSSVALVASIAVAATGFIQSWLLLGGGLDSLTGTRFGNLVLLKWAGFLVLITFGAFNRFKLIPAAEKAGDTGSLARSVRLEMVVAGAVFLVASVLAHTAPA